MEKFSSLDDEDKKKYISNMQTARDTYNQLEYAKKKGREEGLQQGHVEGQNEERILIATKMLQMKLPVQSSVKPPVSLPKKSPNYRVRRDNEP